MNKTIFKDIKDLVTKYNRTMDKVGKLKVSEISDDDLYIICVGDTITVRKKLDVAIQIADGHFESPESIQNYRKLCSTPDPEAFFFPI